MKTKYFLTAMALPLAFAACTNEDVLVENPNVPENAPAVDFKVAATYGADGAESRMVNNNGTFLWENTDVLGGVLNANDAIYSNNKFVNTLTAASASADFTTQATTVVGSYVFYYPYNTNVTKKLSDGIVYSLPNPQEYDPTGEKMMNNNFMISPNVKVDGNEPGELTLPLTMRSIYGYGKLDIKLADNLADASGTAISSVKIQKVVIEYTSNVAKDGKINIANVPSVDLTADNLNSLRNGSNDKYKSKTDAELTAILFKEADNELTAQEENKTYKDGTIIDLTAGEANIGQVAISCLSNENPTGISLSKNAVFSTRVLLPTTDKNGANDYKVTIYTNKGTFEYDLTVAVRIKPNHTINLANPNRTANGAETITITELTKVTAAAGFTAISEADFIANISQYTDGEEVKVSTTGFEMTPEAVEAIPEGVVLDLQNPVTFAGDMTLKNIKSAEITLKSGNIILGENMVGKGTKVNDYVTDVPDVFIEGATVKMTKAMTLENNATRVSVFVKSGSLEIAGVNDKNEAAEITLGNVEVGKADGSTSATLKITNNLKLAWGANLVVNKKSTLENSAVISDEGAASVNIEADATADNEGTVSYLENNGTLNNSGTVANGNNYGVINQKDAKSRLTLYSNGGTINTVANSWTIVEGENSGKIYFESGARVSASKNVIYLAPADIKANQLSQLGSAITTIEFGEDFTYDYVATTQTTEGEESLATLPANVTTLVFKGDLTLAKDWELNKAATVEFVGASANITGAKTLSATALTLKAGVQDSNPSQSGDQKISTDVLIGNGTTIKGVVAVQLSGDATVWNDGTVEKTDDANIGTITGWNGNAIN